MQIIAGRVTQYERPQTGTALAEKFVATETLNVGTFSSNFFPYCVILFL